MVKEKVTEFNPGMKVIFFDEDDKKLYGKIERKVWINTGNNTSEIFYTILSEDFKTRYTIHNQKVRLK